MKKIYLLTVVAFFVTVISATAQRVLLHLPSNYEVTIDDRYYVNNETVNSISYGQHTVKLYQLRPGILGIGKRRVLVNTSFFEMRNNDVNIDVDQYGQLRIYESGNYNDRSGNNNNNNNYPNGEYGNGRNNSRGNCNNGNGYGPYNNPGRGHKYGLYKKHNNKHDKHERDDRDDDNDDDDNNHGRNNRDN